MSDLRSGQLARAADVNRQTLRYYERRGLLAEPHRTPGGHRLYPAQAVTVLRVIKAAQRLGFTLDEVAGLLDSGPHRRRGHPGGLTDHAAIKLAETEAKIAELTAIANALRAALAAGCADLIDCARQPQCPLPLRAAP
jgi:MerR family mercuric resistance operon transcriptional regulator